MGRNCLGAMRLLWSENMLLPIRFYRFSKNKPIATKSIIIFSTTYSSLLAVWWDDDKIVLADCIMRDSRRKRERGGRDRPRSCHVSKWTVYNDVACARAQESVFNWHRKRIDECISKENTIGAVLWLFSPSNFISFLCFDWLNFELIKISLPLRILTHSRPQLTIIFIGIFLRRLIILLAFIKITVVGLTGNRLPGRAWFARRQHLLFWRLVYVRCHCAKKKKKREQR